MISVLCPTRNRFDALIESMRSLVVLAAGEVEFLTYVDDDDPELDRYRLIQPTIVGPRHGYRGLHHCVNALAEKATGDWLFLWNDDARMTTKGWDRIIAQFPPSVLSPASNHPHAAGTVGGCIFPVVPTDWVRRLGHFSMNAHNDTWWGYIGTQLGCLVGVPDVVVFHDRHDLTGGHNDQTFADRDYDPGFFSAETQRQIRDDVEVLRPCVSAGWG